MMCLLNERTGLSKPWFDSDCIKRKKSLKGILKECKAHQFESNLVTLYKEKKVEYENMQRTKNETYRFFILDQLVSAANSSTFCRIINSNKFSPIPKDCINSHITSKQILLSLKKCKNQKASGPDGISYKLLKNLPSNWIKYLNSLFNNILEKEKIPDSWAQSYAKMLHWKGDKHDPNITGQLR